MVIAQLSVPQSRSLQKRVAAPRNATGSSLPIATTERMLQNGSVVNSGSSTRATSRSRRIVHGSLPSSGPVAPMVITRSRPAVSRAQRSSAPG